MLPRDVEEKVRDTEKAGRTAGAKALAVESVAATKRLKNFIAFNVWSFQ